jgi:hypothetical protein
MYILYFALQRTVWGIEAKRCAFDTSHSVKDGGANITLPPSCVSWTPGSYMYSSRVCQGKLWLRNYNITFFWNIDRHITARDTYPPIWGWFREAVLRSLPLEREDCGGPALATPNALSRAQFTVLGLAVGTGLIRCYRTCNMRPYT